MKNTSIHMFYILSYMYSYRLYIIVIYKIIFEYTYIYIHMLTILSFIYTHIFLNIVYIQNICCIQ